jgi:diguanylate cyclase (GGDEF)-like protein/PAS domain S-box-containing protein
MVITDAAGSFLEVNTAFCSFLGYSAKELMGMSFRDVTFAEDFAASAAEMRRFVGGSSSEFCVEKRYVTAAGDAVWGRVTGIAVRESGKLMRVIGHIEDLSERKAAQAALSRRDCYDELTGLVNRRELYSRLRKSLVHRRPSARRIAVLVVNVNRFRQINAGLGQAAADQILREVGCRLLAVTKGQDTVARLGADEFAVLAPRVATSEAAVAMAVELRHSVDEPYWAEGNAVFVSVRVGVVTAPTDGTDAETLVRKATAATEQAKDFSSGWVLHAAGADLASQDELGFLQDLRSAIDNGDLTVAYQPVVDGSGSVHSLEALARWYHPIRGAVPPDQFIALAEQNGLIAPLTRQILTSAVEQAVAWRATGLPISVAVNLSGKLLAHPLLVAQTSLILASAGLPPEALTLEITETVLADGGSQCIRSALDALRATGVRISIDDFGTGYSSLAYLKNLPVDELKIDRSFITDLESDDRTERIVRSIINLAHTLDLTVVAEGVENDSVATRLLDLGVDRLQGFGIAHPAASHTITDWLRNKTPAAVVARSTPEGSRTLDVLVVHDDLTTRSALRKLLAERQHRVVEARSGHAALDKLAKRLPDVIILDHLMPGLTGVETAPRLREAGYAGPILLFSDTPLEQLAAIRFPMDVWPVSTTDEATVLRLIDGYAATPLPV